MAPVLSTVGMFIIDEFVFEPEAVRSRPEGKQLGGGGLFVSLGARMWLPAGEARVIVERGADWQEGHTRELDRYGVAHYRDDPTAQTVCAEFIFSSPLDWQFVMKVPPLRLTPRSLIGTPLFGSTWLHILTPPSRFHEIMQELDELDHWRPRIVYEPYPSTCVPDQLDGIKLALPLVDVFSPNAREAGGLLSLPTDALSGKEPLIEQCCHRFVDLGARDSVIIRSGPLGACLLRRGWTDCVWIPAFHQDASRVVDDTGAGNAFLGGLVAGLHLEGDDLLRAALYGSVSSSFVIEQWGPPRIDGERWNGTRPQDRLHEVRERMKL